MLQVGGVKAIHKDTPRDEKENIMRCLSNMAKSQKPDIKLLYVTVCFHSSILILD